VHPRVNIDTVVKRKTLYPCHESNPGHPAHGLVTILTELSQFQSLILLINFSLEQNVVYYAIYNGFYTPIPKPLLQYPFCKIIHK
jgi:hypothetical protein